MRIITRFVSTHCTQRACRTARRPRPAAADDGRLQLLLRTPAWRRGRSAPPAAQARAPQQAADWDRCGTTGKPTGRHTAQTQNVLHEVAGKPQERLLKVVVALCRDIVVLQVLLAVESDLLGANLAVLDVDLVAHKHNGDVLAHADNVAVPLLHVLVRLSGGYVEHDDGALTHNVVTVAKTTEALLAGSIPHVKHNRTAIGVEDQWSDFNADGSCIIPPNKKYRWYETKGVPIYRFSNSPVKWRLTKVVLPTPPSPTSNSLKVGQPCGIWLGTPAPGKPTRDETQSKT